MLGLLATPLGLALVAGCAGDPSSDRTEQASAAVASSSKDVDLTGLPDSPGIGDPIEYHGDQDSWNATDNDPTVTPTPQDEADIAAATAEAAEAPATAVLSFVWKGQETGYWCGPGSTRMAIDTRLPANELPSQTELANFMGTTTEGSIRVNLIDTLNHYIPPPRPYVSTPMSMVPTQAQRDLLKTTVLARISKGWPVVTNVLSGWRPPGYPSGTIGHFVAVVGYDDAGAKVYIADPAGDGAAGPRWTNVPRTYWISMDNLGRWVGGRGYSR